MPLTKSLGNNLAQISFRNNLRGRILHFGRMYPNIDVTYGFLKSIAVDKISFGNQFGNFGDEELIEHEEVFFKAIGYEAQESLDVSEVESPTHVYDLNQDTIPEKLFQRYDVIYNNGTLEHIFDVPNCLANITRMLKVGGHIIHSLPSNNHFDHGFYQFSPCLFFDYYGVNKFEIKESKIFRRNSKSEDSIGILWGPEYYDPYSPDHPHHYDGKMDAGVYIQVLVAQKTKDSTDDEIPIQGDYSGLVKKSNEDEQRNIEIEKTKLRSQIASCETLIEALNARLEMKEEVEINLYKQLLKAQGIIPKE